MEIILKYKRLQYDSKRGLKAIYSLTAKSVSFLVKQNGYFCVAGNFQYLKRNQKSQKCSNCIVIFFDFEKNTSSKTITNLPIWLQFLRFSTSTVLLCRFFSFEAKPVQGVRQNKKNMTAIIPLNGNSFRPVKKKVNTILIFKGRH